MNKIYDINRLIKTWVMREEEGLLGWPAYMVELRPGIKNFSGFLENDNAE